MSDQRGIDANHAASIWGDPARDCFRDDVMTTMSEKLQKLSAADLKKVAAQTLDKEKDPIVNCNGPLKTHGNAQVFTEELNWDKAMKGFKEDRFEKCAGLPGQFNTVHRKVHSPCAKRTRRRKW